MNTIIYAWLAAISVLITLFFQIAGASNWITNAVGVVGAFFFIVALVRQSYREYREDIDRVKKDDEYY